MKKQLNFISFGLMAIFCFVAFNHYYNSLNHQLSIMLGRDDFVIYNWLVVGFTFLTISLLSIKGDPMARLTKKGVIVL